MFLGWTILTKTTNHLKNKSKLPTVGKSLDSFWDFKRWLLDTFDMKLIQSAALKIASLVFSKKITTSLWETISNSGYIYVRQLPVYKGKSIEPTWRTRTIILRTWIRARVRSIGVQYRRGDKRVVFFISNVLIAFIVAVIVRNKYCRS